MDWKSLVALITGALIALATTVLLRAAHRTYWWRGAPHRAQETFERDKRHLIKFLRTTSKILEGLCHRMPEDVRPQFVALFASDIAGRIERVTGEIDAIESPNHRTWLGLDESGMTGDALGLKIGEFLGWPGRKRLGKLLKSINSILGSIVPVFATLEPVKEFKDFLENRVEDDPEFDVEGVFTELHLP